VTLGNVGLDEVFAPVGFDLLDDGIFSLHIIFLNGLGSMGAWTWFLVGLLRSLYWQGFDGLMG
jgi:hypothetical protein